MHVHAPGLGGDHVAAARHDALPLLVTAHDLVDINPVDRLLLNKASLTKALARLPPKKKEKELVPRRIPMVGLHGRAWPELPDKRSRRHDSRDWRQAGRPDQLHASDHARERARGVGQPRPRASD